MATTLQFPALERRNERLLGSRIRQFRLPPCQASGSIRRFQQGRLHGDMFIPDSGSPLSGQVLIVEQLTASAGLPDLVLLRPPAKAGIRDGERWLRPKPEPFPDDLDLCEEDCRNIVRSWQGCFHFREERRDGGGVVESGLRPPQLGALHATIAHWTVTHDPATIVMPTGTGKTETMLALLVARRLPRLLVIVPNDALREQLASKFQCLGVLPLANVVPAGASLPVVGVLRRKPKTVDEVDTFFRRCNVIVTTAQIAGQCPDTVTKRIADLCSHLFVDEAHHVPALTWTRVRDAFAGKPVLQFTATPYRGDGKLVDGKVIYNYPLRKAQAEGYFKPIRFRAVEEYNEDLADERIASEAVSRLREDLAAGRDHLLMARCNSIRHARALHAVYQRLAPEHAPVLAHSHLGAEENRSAVGALHSRTARIVVCVDMFGEGFDLPQLKIAALHDIHKSLAVTLQFTGRFTRTSSDVGDATIVANVANPSVDDALRALYGEDPDWNHLLRELTEEASGEHALRSEFLQGFTEPPERIPLQNVFPKMSTVVFRTECERWHPNRAGSVIRNVYDQAQHPRQHVLLVVTRTQHPIDWGDIRGMCDTVYDLYLIHWDESMRLLYIHSSDKSSTHEDIAKAVCGESVKLIRGEQVFRALDGINRLILTNMGLGHSLSRAVRFTMHVGADIREGLTAAHAENKYKTNLFGRGFSEGDRTTIGCSIKGRIWSYLVAGDIGQWVAWSQGVGRKLLDDRIDVGSVLNGAMVPHTVTARPALVPITIEWSEDVLDRSEECVRFELAGLESGLSEVGLTLVAPDEDGPIRFEVSADRWTGTARYEIRFNGEKVEYVPTAGVDPTVKVGRRKRLLSEYLQAEPPVVRFHDGSFLIYNDMFDAPGGPRQPFDSSRIVDWNWSGIDLGKESQTAAKLADSIQRRVIERVLAESGPNRFEVVFDDDAAGEAADVVAMRLEAERLLVRLYHCKYSQEPFPGARVKDLYEVCGQAQRSVYWKGQPARLIDHLIDRDSARTRRSEPSRFERGALRDLNRIRGKLRSVRVDFEIYVVQPGVAKSRATQAQLELLAVTELYLRETYGASLGVIASP